MTIIEADLHLHTTFSDGTLTPTQLVALCAERGLKTICISDHDTTNGLQEAFDAAAAHPDITVIPGIELSTDVPGSEIHILGYFVDHSDASLQAILEDFRSGREDRGMKMVENLNNLGLAISWERVQQIAGDASIGRPHIAQALVEAGYVKYPRDAFDEYLGRNGSAYVERPKLLPEDAVRLLVEHGALPVMAHPTYSASKSDREGVSSLPDILGKLKSAGLVGMEVYYGDYTPEQVEWLHGLADDFDLIPCGGSDYHALGNPDEPEPGTVGPPMSSVEALYALRATAAI
ncbi:MAG: PHP domain-containing protein [Chloroflexi bacterium]|nr:PHP domain-containing protein [Chloroflexota bacterium]